MPATTPRYAFPYPTANDTLAAFPGTIKDLALAVEGKIAALAAGDLDPAALIPTSVPGPGVITGEMQILSPMIPTGAVLILWIDGTRATVDIYAKGGFAGTTKVHGSEGCTAVRGQGTARPIFAGASAITGTRQIDTIHYLIIPA